MACSAPSFGRARCRDLTSLLDTFHAAAATSNLEVWAGCFLSANSRFLGTDMAENWTAQNAVETFAPHFAKSTCAWNYVPVPGSRIIEVFDGNAFATFDEGLKSESFRCTSRGTGVAVRGPDDCWFLQQYYLSFPIPNPLAKKMCGEIADWEAKSAADKAVADLLAAEETGSGSGGGSASKKKGGKR